MLFGLAAGVVADATTYMVVMLRFGMEWKLYKLTHYIFDVKCASITSIREFVDD